MLPSYSCCCLLVYPASLLVFSGYQNYIGSAISVVSDYAPFFSF